MKKETIIGIVVGILIFIGGYFYLDNQERLMDEETRVGEPVKMDLPKTETQKVEDEKYTEELAKFSNEHNKTRTQKKSSKKFKTLEDGTKHEIIPYTEKLPPMPDEEENNSTLFGVDSNNNGVRDDLEILAVQLFGEDRDVVEAEFAAIRAGKMFIDIAINKQETITHKTIQKIMNYIYETGECLMYYGGYSSIKKEEKIHELHINTLERKKAEGIIVSQLSGMADSFNASDETCKEFFEETKQYEYFN